MIHCSPLSLLGAKLMVAKDLLKDKADFALF